MSSLPFGTDWGTHQLNTSVALPITAPISVARNSGPNGYMPSVPLVPGVTNPPTGNPFSRRQTQPFVNKHAAVDMRTLKDIRKVEGEISFVFHDDSRDVSIPIEITRPLSDLNRYLESYEGRRKYGQDDSAMILFDEWKFIGNFATSALPSRTMGQSKSATIAFTMCGSQTMIPNVFIAHAEGPMRQLDKLWMLYVRFKFDKDVAIGMNSGDNKQSDDEYYWQVIPYSTSPDVIKPPEEMYNGQEDDGRYNNSFLGAYKEVGRVTTFRGVTYNQPKLKANAKRAVHPKGPGDAYKQDLYSIGSLNASWGTF